MPSDNERGRRIRGDGRVHWVEMDREILPAHRGGISIIEELELRIGHRFQNENLLREALIHSFEQGHVERGVRSNVRLAWLGDSVVDVCVSEDLYRVLERFDLALIDSARQSLVNQDNLAFAATSLGLDGCLTSSSGAPVPENQMSTGTLEKAFEAVVGAVYLDGGASAARDLVRTVLRADQASSFDSFGRYIYHPGS